MAVSFLPRVYQIKNEFYASNDFDTAGDNDSGSICILCSVLGYFDPLKLQLKVLPHP